MRTKSPTTNWDEDAVPDKVLVCNAVFRMSAEGDIIVEEVRDRTLSDDSEELVTLVKIAGLKVHLKNAGKEESVWEMSKGSGCFYTCKLPSSRLVEHKLSAV